MAKLTIKDIARMAGVSTTAVSFVINGRSGVSEATQEKVQQIIRQTGFIPNVHTRRLNLGKSFTVHVVLQQYGYDLFNQFSLETLGGIFREGNALGYNISFTLVDEDTNCDQVIDSVRSKECDGVILDQISDPTLISRLQAEQIPFVCTSPRLPQCPDIPKVEVDYYTTAYQAAKFLHTHGHTRIGFLSPLLGTDHYTQGLRGYTDYLAEHNLEQNPHWLCRFPLSTEDAKAALDQLLTLPHGPTALLCINDAFAADAMTYLKEKDMKLPEELSLIGAGDLLVSRYLDPPLTTMGLDKSLLGAKAMQLLYQIIQNMERETAIRIPCTPVERRSVKNI